MVELVVLLLIDVDVVVVAVVVVVIVVVVAVVVVVVVVVVVEVGGVHPASGPSSSPPAQSSWPSHFQPCTMHLRSDAH